MLILAILKQKLLIFLKRILFFLYLVNIKVQKPTKKDDFIDINS